MPSVYMTLHLTARSSGKPTVTTRQPGDIARHAGIPLIWTPFTAMRPHGPKPFVQVDVGVQDKDCLAGDSWGLFWSREDAEKAMLASIEETVVERIRSWEEVSFLWDYAGSGNGVGVLGRILGAADDKRHWREVVSVEVAA